MLDQFALENTRTHCHETQTAATPFRRLRPERTVCAPLRRCTNESKGRHSALPPCTRVAGSDCQKKSRLQCEETQTAATPREKIAAALRLPITPVLVQMRWKGTSRTVNADSVRDELAPELVEHRSEVRLRGLQPILVWFGSTRRRGRGEQ